MPNEFWREVVDRVADEESDTLLLAEAFWLMEGFFVRTLGMHRVYNSAFMNMMRDEDNAKYRSVIKNTLEFDHEILKRYVNFMNNPDEKTAVEQFGKGDKYFGICIMMSTLPGLPMFGHGQLEGFSEKYGMEYRKAYWNESEDHAFIQRHKHQISPLLHKRYLFAGSEYFRLYDFITPNGHVDENVFAFSNRSNNEKTLIIYNNKFSTTKGQIKHSVKFNAKTDYSDNISLVSTTLADGLNLSGNPETFVVYRDMITGLHYLNKSRDIIDNGLVFELDAYKYHVLLDFEEIHDNEQGHYSSVESDLNGRGVLDIEEALHEISLEPVLKPFRSLINTAFTKQLITSISKSAEPNIFDELKNRYRKLLDAIYNFYNISEDQPIKISQLLKLFESEMIAISSFLKYKSQDPLVCQVDL